MGEKGSAQQTKALFSEAHSTGNAYVYVGANTGASNGTLEVLIVNDANTTLLSRGSTQTALDNTWHHVVFTDNNGSATLYIDGVADASDFSYTRSGAFTFNRAAVGADGNGLFKFVGAVDEVRLYNRALTAAEAKQLYNLGAASIRQ